MRRLNEEIEGKLLRTIPLKKFCLANFAYTRIPLSCQAVVPPSTYRITVISTLQHSSIVLNDSDTSKTSFSDDPHTP